MQHWQRQLKRIGSKEQSSKDKGHQNHCATTQLNESSKPVQCRFTGVQQHATDAVTGSDNHTGMPNQLKSGLEQLSGFDLSPVRVHYNSPQPSKVGALAYAQGTNIHLGRGQEKHLPHEGWHVVQQMQGRVKANTQMKGCDINNDSSLEREADVMGMRAAQMNAGMPQDNFKKSNFLRPSAIGSASSGIETVQRKIGFEFETPWVLMAPARILGPDTAVVTGVGWDLVPDFTSTFIQADGSIVLPPELQETETEERGWFGRTKTVKHPPKYSGFGHMEFVTDAYDESDAGLGELIATLYSIKFFVERLATAVGREVPLYPNVRGRINWSAHAGGFSQDVLRRVVVNNTAAFSATPQMTGGIKLSQIPRLLDMMGSNTPMARYLNRGRAADVDGSQPRMIAKAMTEARRVTAANQVFAGFGEAQKNQYLGAVAHLTNIILVGKVSDPAKTKYLTTLLSRTDFGKLPDFILHPDTNLKADVLAATAAAEGDYLFAGAHKASKVKVGAWLDGILAGKDLIDWGQDRKNVDKNRRWEPQEVGQEGDKEIGHVYEFRGAGTNLSTTDQWMSYALGMFELVRYINDSSGAVPGRDSSKGKRLRNLPNIR